MDAYAGTGAVGIEALSRGAARAIFLEKNRAALEVIRGNLAALELAGRSDVVPGPVIANLALYPADMVFLDPPYDLEGEYAAALEALAGRPPALVIVQHAARFPLAAEFSPLRRTRLLRQGDNALSFFTAAC